MRKSQVSQKTNKSKADKKGAQANAGDAKSLSKLKSKASNKTKQQSEVDKAEVEHQSAAAEGELNVAQPVEEVDPNAGSALVDAGMADEQMDAEGAEDAPAAPKQSDDGNMMPQMDNEENMAIPEGSIPGSVNGDDGLVAGDGADKAQTELDYADQELNELEMDLAGQENADHRTEANFDRDGEMIDGSQFNEVASAEDPSDKENVDDFADEEILENKDHQEDMVDDIFNVEGQNDLDGSIHPLTLKDGVNYEANAQNKVTVDMNDFDAAGFDDEIMGTGQNEIEMQNLAQDQAEEQQREMDYIKEELEDNIREQYLNKFRKEVDFHHKVAYRYEKAYRLGKKQPQKKQQLNFEIIEIISDHADYIDQDPMALFYCLYFCVYYNNPELVEFLRTLIAKMQNKPEKIDQMLEFIDVNGIERIRTIGEQINSHVYHMVFYQAVDDDLRVVYAQILRQLKFIQLRDKDALQLLKQRDYDLIRHTFDKLTTKLNIALFFKKTFSLKSQNYRRYNQAFYEEILIDYYVESRVALNYRERFITTVEEIYLVLEMYSKMDYYNHFLKSDLEEITHKQFVDLFMMALKNDSFKIAMQIYLRFLNSFDIDGRIMDILILSLKDSLRFHEMKLFFIHQHFDVMTVAQMNHLVDTYMEILNRKEFKLNPVLSQFNTIKYSLLIYRISWKISQKRIYSLITKCSVLNSYILKGLFSYLDKQQHISQLHKFMREPIFHMTERKDSLDIMLEMQMEDLLKNPVIVEVLNLVNEGMYSVDSSAMSLSQTFQSFFLMDTADLKSINLRLINNISTFGDAGGGKQASLQFNIWKQCIEQREQDEMLFTVIISVAFLFLAFWLDLTVSQLFLDVNEVFGGNFIGATHILQNAQPEVIKDFCPIAKQDLLQLNGIVSNMSVLVIFSGIGYLTAIIQKLTVLRLKDNVQLSIGHILIELAIVAASSVFLVISFTKSQNTLVSEACDGLVELTAEETKNVDYIYSILAQTNTLNFQLIVSALVMLYTLIMVLMLQRTQKLGELIMMVFQMINELKKFILTFGILIGGFIVVGRQLNEEIKTKEASFFQIILDTFDGLNGKQNFENYQFPQGKIFITLFVYIFNILLLSFLVSMFINRYKVVYTNLDAIRRMNIIRLKNSSSFDALTGGVTITFFPISILVLPFIVPVVVFKSERLNEFILKIQYAFMIILYCGIAIVLSVPIIPLMYFKCVSNSFYIALNNKRQDYRGQNMINLTLTCLLNPIIILVSLLIDLISLPSLLLKDEKGFEFKYQQSLEILTKDQVTVILTTFAKIFYINFEQKFEGKSKTLIELMQMHRAIFQISNNLHELFCRGTKDSKEALSNVQDYNMTKILSRKCSVPDRSGDIKQSACEFNILYALQMDIELYNYVDILITDYRKGKLASEKGENKDKKKAQKDEDSGSKEGEGQLNAGVVFLAMASSPVGLTFKRDNADVMNNFYINIVTRAYTSIDEFLKNLRDSIDASKQKETLKELEFIKSNWTSSIYNEVSDQFDKFDKNVDEFQTNYKSVKGKHPKGSQKNDDMLDEVTMMSYTKGTIGGPAHTATDDLQNIMNL